jgi:hypothetical protein
MSDSSVQLLLPLHRRSVEIKALVRLNETDLQYRQSCIDKDLEFSEGFLKETRSQRLGCSVRDLECMLNYERNRHLAEEAVAMRLPTWSTDSATWIDWKTINKRSVARADELAADFAAFRKHRSQTLLIEAAKPKRGKR